jgi:histidinol-phosphatase
LIAQADRTTLLVAARAVIATARQVTLAHQANGFKAWTKADASVVTDADLAVESSIRDSLAERFPDHGVQGEEFPAVNPEADFQWITDPIDGTISFSRGIPLYGTILGLYYRGEPVVGVIDHPGLDRCYSAAAGLGAFCDERRLALRDLGPDDAVEGEVIGTGDRSQFLKVERGDAFDALPHHHPRVRTYADCFGHTLACEGALGAMVDFGLRTWDLAASRLLIEEAGGKYALVQQVAAPDGTMLFGVILGRPKVVDWLLPYFA